MTIQWNNTVSRVIQKRLTSESKNWHNITDRPVIVQGEFNNTRVIFQNVCFSSTWLHQQYLYVKKNNRKSEINFLETLILQDCGDPQTWKMCQQLDRQLPVNTIWGDDQDTLWWIRWIFPWLSNTSNSIHNGIHRTHPLFNRLDRVEFVLSNHYPFRGSDKILIGNNCIPYSSVLSSYMVKYYHKLAPGCLCCESFSCASRWYPMIQLYMVLLEISKNIRLRKRMREHDMADRVVHWWTPWKKGRPGENDRMLWAQYIPVELRIRDFL